MDIAKLTLIGRLTANPEQRTGTVKLTLRVNYAWRDAQAMKRHRSELVVVYATEKLAEICTQYLRAESRIYCEAHLVKGRFVADEIIMLGSPKHDLTDSVSPLA